MRVRIGEVEVKPPTADVHFEEWGARVTIQNVGREAAIIIDSAIQLRTSLRPPVVPRPGIDEFDRVWTFNSFEDGDVILPGGDLSTTVSRLMDPEKCESEATFKSYQASLFVFGIVLYEDPLGIRRELGFTRAWARGEAEAGEAFFRCALDGRNYDRIVSADSNPIRFKPLETTNNTR
ncbi:MAG: hypothetical protein ACHP7N_09580 [Caulobacterales bacterium]